MEFAGRALDLPRPNLPGAHQIVNGGLAVAAVLELNRAGVLPTRPLDDAAIAAGLRHADWPARLQRLTRGPLVAALPPGWELWLDGGHNPAGGVALAAMADAWATEPGAPPLDMVVGMLDTKDARGFFAPFADKLRRLRTVTIPNEVHAVTAEPLAETARAAGLPAEPAPSMGAALAEFAHTAPDQQRGRVLICGSLYLAGVVLAENG